MINKKFKSYKDCIEYLFNLERAGIKYDLKNIKSLLIYLNNPQNSFKSIHVAGTNGKGSVSSIINSFLIEKGFRSGLYTSPHITDFRERILVDGKFITKKFIVEFVSRLYGEIEKIKPSFFEVTTAMAFEYFRYKKTDYAVIEAGLGGRLDSTNIINPVISVITSISMDHTNLLGNTIESITREKGGIIKKNIPFVAGKIPEVSKPILSKIAKDKKSEIVFSQSHSRVKIVKKTESGFYFSCGSKLRNMFFPMIGDFQKNNIRTALSAIDKISEVGNMNAEKLVLQNTFKNLKINSKISGRFELVSVKPKIVIDVSHNPQAISNIKNSLKYFKFNRLIIIFAMVHDKDHRKSVRILENLKADIIFTKPAYHRFAETKVLFDSLSRKSGHIIKEKLSEAFAYAEQVSGANDLILVTGSFFLVSEFLSLLRRTREKRNAESLSG